MVKLVNRARMSTSTTGTGTITLGSAENGYQSFDDAGVPDGDIVRYVIEDGANWEVGTGTYTASGTTLTRTVTESSNADAALNLSGNAVVFIGPAAQDFSPTITLAGDASGSVTLTDLEDATLTVTVADDSHNHTIANVDNLQTNLDAKLAKSGGTMTGNLILNADPTTALGAATKEYVDTIAAAGLHYHNPVRVQTTANLSATYDNGTAGVGATLTNNSTQAVISIDGVTLSSADRVLVTEQTNAAHNGVYTVTNVGSASTNWVLTRATDADSYGASDPDALGQGDAFFIKEGNTNAGHLDVMNTEGTITFGTTNITFTEVAETTVYSAGTDITLSGTTFNLNSTIAADTTGNAATATALETARTIGGVSFDGTANINLAGVNTTGNQDTTGNAATATAWETARTITLSGDVSGTATGVDGSGNVSITTTVADDSHAHVISNVDGLQTALDAKAPTASPTFSGTITFPTGQTFDGRDVSADGTKLDGIESGADVTDATNVSAAGALMKTGGQMSGNITMAGAQTVDGRDLSVDGAKLDGIESGATADQTASEILTKIKTVDGSGSGLDADTLDGQQGSYYAPLAAPALTGDVKAVNMLAVGTSGTPRLTGQSDVIEIHGNTASFHMGVQDGSGRVQMRWNASKGTNPTYQVSNEPSARYEILDVTSVADSLWKIDHAGNGTAGSTIAYTNILSLGTTTFTYNGNNVWHAGNDGSGSGLDADTVDGIQASSFLRSDAADSTSSTISFTGNIELGNAMYHSGDPDTYLQFVGANDFRIVTGNTEQFSANSTNGVEIPDKIVHTGDDDTYMQFSTANTWRVVAGGTEMLKVDTGGVEVGSTLDMNGNIISECEDIYLRDKIYHDGDLDTFIGMNTDMIMLAVGNEQTQINTSGIVLTSGIVREKHVSLSGTTPSVTYADGGSFDITLTGNTTFTFGTASSGYSTGFIIEVTGDASTAYTITWPAVVDWAGGTAPDAPAVGEKDIYVFWTRDGGTIWHGALALDASA